MNRLVTASAFALALTFGGAAANAQNAPRTYENGPVVETSFVETKPGMFNDYMQYLATTWRAEQEAAKKDGDVIEYHVLALDHPRAGEADLELVVIYKNMAVFDRSQEFLDARTAKLEGSVAKSNQSFMDRSAVRTLRGSVISRELVFK